MGEPLNKQKIAVILSLLVAGLAAIIAAYCYPLPASPILSIRVVFFTAAKYLLAPIVTASLVLLFHRLRRGRSASEKQHLFLHAGPGLVLVPPTILALRHNSRWAIPVAFVASTLAAVCTKSIVPANEAAHSPNMLAGNREALLFQLPPYTGPGLWTALLLAAGIYGATLCLFSGHLLLATMLAAACVFVMTWRWDISSRLVADHPHKRLGWTLALAFLLTFLALFPWQYRHGVNTVAGVQRTAHSVPRTRRHDAQVAPLSGYHGIILEAPPRKKTPLPPPTLFPSENHRTAPLILPFDGTYWYFQAPDLSPGRRAYITRGDPLTAGIHSSNLLPLLMEAHQSLSVPMGSSCCSQLKVVFKNGENRSQDIHIGIALTDLLTPGHPAQFLGEQPVPPIPPGETPPVEETLTFSIPFSSSVPRFDGITVFISPSQAWLRTGTKIAIEHFEFVPR